MKHSKANAYRVKHKRCKHCVYCKESSFGTVLSSMLWIGTHECIVKKHYWSDIWFNGLRGTFCSVFEPEFLKEVTEEERIS